MKKSERFALNEWLTEFPDNTAYEAILQSLKTNNPMDDITVWEVAENYPLEMVAMFIQDTQEHFANITEE